MLKCCNASGRCDFLNIFLGFIVYLSTFLAHFVACLSSLLHLIGSNSLCRSFVVFRLYHFHTSNSLWTADFYLSYLGSTARNLFLWLYLHTNSLCMTIKSQMLNLWSGRTGKIIGKNLPASTFSTNCAEGRQREKKKGGSAAFLQQDRGIVMTDMTLCGKQHSLTFYSSSQIRRISFIIIIVICM